MAQAETCSTLRAAKLQRVEDGCSEHETLAQRPSSLFQLAFERGEELKAGGVQSLFCPLWRDIAFVGKHLTKQLLEQWRHRGAVSRGARSEHDVEPLSPVIHDQMECETKEP